MSGSARRVVANRNQPRRFGASAADAEQHAHAEPFQFLVTQRFHGKAAIAAQYGKPLGKYRRRECIRRLDVQRARHVAMFANDAAAFDGGRRGVR